MSDTTIGAIDMTLAASARKDLAGAARRLVAKDPGSAVEMFRHQIRPYLIGGRAWLVEPSVRVLVTELRRNAAAWAQVGADAERLLEEAEEAQSDALTLSTAVTQTEVSGGLSIERAFIKTSAPYIERPPEGRRVWELLPIESVAVNCLSLSGSEINQAVWSSLLIEQKSMLTLLGTAFGSAAYDFADPAAFFGARRSRGSLWTSIHSLFGRRTERAADALRRRVYGAMLTVPKNEVFITVLYEHARSNASAEFYLCELASTSFEQVRSHALRTVEVKVDRPTNLPSDDVVALADELARRDLPMLTWANGSIGIRAVEAT